MEHPGGFTFQYLFESNLVNWLLLVVGIIYLWQKYMPAVFKQREEQTEAALKDAALAKKQGEELLAEIRSRLANKDAELEKIRNEGKQLAEQLKKQMEEQTNKDAKDLELKIKQQMANERQLAITQLRQAAAQAAIKLTEQVLPTLLDEKAKAQLLNQFMEQLDAASGEGQMISPNKFESAGKR
jgi:F-type H+-transporting ATPase subunit b